MTEIILRIPLKNSSVKLTDDELIVNLENGVRLRTEPLPAWVTNIRSVTFQLNIVVDGSPDASSLEPPVK